MITNTSNMFFIYNEIKYKYDKIKNVFAFEK